MEQQSGNGLAITGMILGIVGLVLSCIPCCGLFVLGGLLAIAGLIISVVALKKGVGKGFAIAGAICGGFGTLVFLGYVIFFIIYILIYGLAAFTALIGSMGSAASSGYYY